MINVILGALLPVVVTLGLGMLAGWHHDQDVGAARSLNHVVLSYALPLALFAVRPDERRNSVLNFAVAVRCKCGEIRI